MDMPKRAYDGATRAAKAAATRERIVECASELYRGKGAQSITLEEIARCAGVTVQTVLRGFSTKENLLLAALSRLGRLGARWLEQTAPGDAGAAVQAIFDVYESVGDLVIQQLGDETRYPTLRPGLEEGRANHRAWVKEIFAPQLAARKGEDQDEVLRILDIATDVYVWKLLRRDMALNRAAAEAVVRRMIACVTRESEDGENSVVELVGRRKPSAKSRNRPRAR
jgi:AcrR family transcriptional regulator